ncbi:MAG: hypothetical protein FE78DRAFT_139424 [Acidomyces sp. 'richmondensis']|nr:MAG: hypothetical protein FE78DRAFT_139424 [Acidomyces sp. 'richmondensis']
MSGTNADIIDARGGSGRDPQYENFLQHYRTVDSVTIPKEYFEKISAEERAPRAVLRTVLGNPFPMALMGFLMASTPLGCTLMGWRGAGGAGAALIGTFYFFGGMLQIIGALMEWIIGNTFPCVVFASYGAFWLTTGMTLTPEYDAMKAYSSTAEFYNTYGFFYMIMTVLTFLYVLASLRTNIVLVVTFFFIDMAFFMLMSSYWVAAEGKPKISHDLQIAAGAFVFTFCMSGWYLWFSIILTSLDFPFIIPLGDLSKRFPSMTEMKKRKMERRGKQQNDNINGAGEHQEKEV